MLTRQKLLWLLCLMVGPLALGYAAVGFYCLVMDVGWSYPIDLHQRWDEERFVARGINPQGHGHPDLPPEHAFQMTTLGGGYPPWAFSTALALVPPLDWGLTRWYFAGVNLLAITVIATWAYRRGRPHGRLAATATALTALSLCPIATCLSYGQYAIIVMALLVVALALCEKGYDGLAGVCLGVALLKPNLAGPFFLAILLLRRNPRFLAGTLGYLAVAFGVTCVTVGDNPLSMMRVWLEDAKLSSFMSHNPLSLWLTDVIGFRAAAPVLAAAVLTAGMGTILTLKRRASRETVVALCALTAMFWTYRRPYDGVVLGFVMVAFLLLALRTGSRPAALVFLLLGASLWVPLRVGQLVQPVMLWTHTAVWLFAGLALAFLDRKSYRIADEPMIRVGSAALAWPPASSLPNPTDDDAHAGAGRTEP